MNEDILKGKWKQLEGEVIKEWGKLTKNDIEVVNGEAKILKGKIQEKYGKTAEEAETQLKNFLKKFEK
ncbi:CsbD family protein [Saccharicrinis aurantiacus]|uniref:CsbD family protein n=1 Tax=Saccharicrinis aurantiacus TaxID=1849719 RepID=UPI00094F8C1E|nr:CsbD family protein [Saccharicrinis aurantiacus]